MAANWKLPVVFVCENNGYAIHSRIEDMHPTEDIASLALGYDMPAVVVDGQDVFACAEAMLAATERARNGDGPTLVEAKTLRYREHDIGTPDLDRHAPRDKAALEEMKKRDPLPLATEQVLANKVLTQAKVDAIHEAAAEEVAEAERFADESEIAQPTLEELRAAVYAS